jgi:serine/threonine protein kinase
MVVTSEDPSQQGDLIGQRCGGSYTIVELLGEGGMGRVYHARSDLLAGKDAAVKVLHEHMKYKSEALSRFRAEVSVAGRITDSNIVKVFDAGTLEDGRLYMMMEYCGGGSLASLLKRRGPLPFDLVVTLIAPICSALDAAHDAKITHRDIKPENILLLAPEPGAPLRAKLADFGIAKLHDAQLELGLHTGTKKILGSPGYMAPEQCIGRRGGVEHRADIYALGSLLYEAVTGRRPYPGDNLYELISNTVQNAPYPRPSELRSDLPPEGEDVSLRCLAHRREDRIQSVREVIYGLARAIRNGEALMGYVAPRLIENRIAPTAITITDGIGPAATRWATHWSGSDLSRSGRRRDLGRTLATLGLGALLGGGAMGIAAAMLDDAPARETEPIVVAPPPGRPVSEPPGAPPPPDAAVPIDAAATTRVVPGKGVTSGPPPGPGSSGPGVDRPVRTTAVPASPGTLRVLVDPWADVAIVGRKETFTSPGTIPLPAGTYRVVLTKGTKKETIDVKINPSQVTTITRTF